jgi:hypothetical protein
MAAKVKSSFNNVVFSMEQYLRKTLNDWSQELVKNHKEILDEYRNEVIKQCIKSFAQEYEFEDDFLEEVTKCADHIKKPKLTLFVPNFMNSDTEPLDEEDAEKEKKEYKKLLFSIKKQRVKKQGGGAGKRRCVTAYNLFQRKRRQELKNDKKSTKEIREILKKEWKDIKENDHDRLTELEEEAGKMEKLPDLKPVNKGNKYALKAYHIFAKAERVLYAENNPEASKEDIREHVKNEWKNVRENNKQYQKYLDEAEEEMKRKLEVISEEEEEKEEKPKKQNKKKQNIIVDTDNEEEEEKKEEDEKKEEKHRKKDIDIDDQDSEVDVNISDSDDEIVIDEDSE